jgi:hypothetical protein
MRGHRARPGRLKESIGRNRAFGKLRPRLGVDRVQVDKLGGR